MSMCIICVWDLLGWSVDFQNPQFRSISPSGRGWRHRLRWSHPEPHPAFSGPAWGIPRRRCTWMCAQDGNLQRKMLRKSNPRNAICIYLYIYICIIRLFTDVCFWCYRSVASCWWPFDFRSSCQTGWGVWWLTCWRQWIIYTLTACHCLRCKISWHTMTPKEKERERESEEANMYTQAHRLIISMSLLS